MNLRSTAIRWYNNVFKDSQLYLDMLYTVEDSPWHRERNVGVHTDMVVAEYISKSDKNWDTNILLGFLTCVFHDVGKPAAEIIKNNEKRGNYKAYHGHELISSRMWENFICDNQNVVELFKLTDNNIYGITWMIEHHVPWATKDIRKLEHYAKTINFITSRNAYIFYNVLLSDTYGRISDDYENKIEAAEDWVSDFHDILLGTMDVGVVDDKVVYIPIGPSGCGKSTYYNEINRELEYYSWDQYRLEWYPAENYSESFELACADKQFGNKVNAEYINMLKAGKSIYVDNTNLSKKRRGFFVNEARKKGYKVIALTFPLSQKELDERQFDREDKIIHSKIYLGMYNKVQQPSYGEFDMVEVIR